MPNTAEDWTQEVESNLHETEKEAVRQIVAAEDETPALNMGLMKRYAQLENEIEKVEAQLKKLKSQKALMEETIMDDFVNTGIDKLTIMGRTIFTSTLVVAKYGDREQAADALKAAGLGVYLKENFNANSLSAYVRTQIKNGEQLPPEFEGVIWSEEIHRVKSCKASNRS